jgi:hypothetical protein
MCVPALHLHSGHEMPLKARFNSVSENFIFNIPEDIDDDSSKILKNTCENRERIYSPDSKRELSSRLYKVAKKHAQSIINKAVLDTIA